MRTPERLREFGLPRRSQRLREFIETRNDAARLQLTRRQRIADPDPPLVTVRIATYNRGDLLAERVLPSICAQTYSHLDILVIGDCADARTAAAVTQFPDPRVRFVNLPSRGNYPPGKQERWMVAGGYPMNIGNQLAQGTWIAPCDDDDEFTKDHVEVLLDAAREQELEFMYSIADFQELDGTWSRVGSWPPRINQISHGTVLLRSDLRFFQYSLDSFRLQEPADYNLWRRMRQAGVKMGFLPQVTYRHFR